MAERRVEHNPRVPGGEPRAVPGAVRRGKRLCGVSVRRERASGDVEYRSATIERIRGGGGAGKNDGYVLYRRRNTKKKTIRSAGASRAARNSAS